MFPIIQRAVIDRKKWIDEATFTELLIIAQSSPGPVAINTAVFVGYKRCGLKGAFAAALGTVLPSLIIILLIAMFFESIRENAYVEAAFKGMRPAVVALIVGPVVSLSRSLSWWKIGMAALVAVAIWLWGFSPVWILLIGAVVGVVCVALSSRKLKKD